VGTGAAKALVLVSTLILGRQLGPEGFGLYSLVFAYLAFFELFADAGLDALLGRDLARPSPDAGRRLGDALILRAVLTVIAVPVAALLFPLVTGRPEGIWLVVLGGASLLASNRRPSLRSILETPYRVSLRMGVPTFLGVLAEALHVALLVLWIPRAGVTGAVAAQALAALPFLFVLAPLSARRLKPEIRPEMARLTGLLHTTAPILAVLAVNVVLARIDAVMLELLRGTRDVGLYTAPVRIVEIANLAPILLMTSVYPLIAASHPKDPVRVDRLFKGSLRVLVTGVVPVVAAEIVFAAPLVERLFGPSYAESARVLSVLAVSAIFVYADIVLTSRLVATGAEARNVWLLGIAAATNVLANLWLIPSQGPRGAAFATSIAYVVRLLSGWLFADTRALTRLAMASFVPALGAGAVAFAPALLFETARPLTFGLGLALYPIALYLLGGFRLHDLAQLRRAMESAASEAGEVGHDPRED
jgi:O-antigen/teichoic acid export membrane protein